MTKASQLREMDDTEMETRLAETKQELFNLRFQHVTGQLDNYKRLRQVRKEIARLETLLREREIAAAEATAGGQARPVPAPESAPAPAAETPGEEGRA